MKRIIAFTALLATAACGGDPVGWAPDPEPTVEAADLRVAEGSTFRLAPGELAAVADGELLVAFRGVLTDSRCPVDVTCVWAGEAEVVIGTATLGSEWSWSTLQAVGDQRSVRANGYLVRLVGLEPGARAEGEIETDEYRVLIQAMRD